MRKRIILAAFAAFVGIAAAMAQQIAVVSESGATSVHQTLTEAIEEASNGSVIYLPGGGFQIHDSVKITKRLSIIGIGHKAKNENVDGNTTISGNLFFNEGSSGSSVMGCYISGNVIISSTNNITVKYCNLNSIQVSNSSCSGTIINQNYIRNNSSCSDTQVTFTNNIMHSLLHVKGGIIKNNIFTTWGDAYTGSLNYIYSSTITDNIIHDVWDGNSSYFRFDGCLITDNMMGGSLGENIIRPGEGKSWNDVFVKCNDMKITPNSDFHFKPEYQQYSDCGIYGGDSFSDGALPPVPFIVSKSIPEQTDASGKLNIKIRVKAGE